MKKILFFMSAMLVLTLSSFGQDLAALDAKYGFKTAKFETPLSSFKNLTKFDEEYNGYDVNNTDLHIGTYTIVDVSYYFVDNKLADIAISVTPNYTNVMGILKVLETAYGKAEKKEKVPDRNIMYNWRGKNVYMSYEILSKSDGTVFEANISITSVKLEQLRQANETNKENLADKKATKDL